METKLVEATTDNTPNTPNTVTSEVTSSNYGGNDGASDNDENDDGIVREQDRLLPIANVARIMKQAIPQTAKISKDAKECVQECVSEFIAFVTSEYTFLFVILYYRACDRCSQEKRKTINGEDIIWAMEALGFEQYAHVMKMYLAKYKEVKFFFLIIG